MYSLNRMTGTMSAATLCYGNLKPYSEVVHTYFSNNPFAHIRPQTFYCKVRINQTARQDVNT